MTQFCLIRHAAHDLLGVRLAGRMPGVYLNAAGQKAAQGLVERLAEVPFTAIYSSPRERAQETAAPLAAARRTEVRLVEEADDIDFGDWTGRAFAELAPEPQWPIWIERRSAAQPPGGETIGEVQARILQVLAQLAEAHPAGTVALFSHCDVIKAALAHLLACSLDALERFEIAPASVSVIRYTADWTQVVRVNDTGPLAG